MLLILRLKVLLPMERAMPVGPILEQVVPMELLLELAMDLLVHPSLHLLVLLQQALVLLLFLFVTLLQCNRFPSNYDLNICYHLYPKLFRKQLI